MTYKENITAILECYFIGFKREIIESACNRILEQEPKTGHWIYKQYGGYPEQGDYHCSECDNIDNRSPEYCSHCGARMVEPQERSGEK